jgi:hypothetical protein
MGLDGVDNDHQTSGFAFTGVFALYHRLAGGRVLRYPTSDNEDADETPVPR